MKTGILTLLTIIMLVVNFSMNLSAQEIRFIDNLNREIIKNIQVTDDKNNILDAGKLTCQDLVEGVWYKAISQNYNTLIFNKNSAISRTGILYLNQKNNSLKEVVITASKKSQNRSEVPYMIETIGQKEIKQYNALSSAQLIERSGKAFVQMSQFGGGSPILRGFEANRVLLVVDGIRLNNAIYRAGHLQDIITVDVNQLDKTEILFGPSSLLYGSDAIGGVIHLITKSPKLYQDGEKTFKAGIGTRYSSAANERTGTLDMEYSGKKIANLTSFSFSAFGDLMSGKNVNPFDSTKWMRNKYITQVNGVDSIVNNSEPYKQVFSGYNQYNFLNKLVFNPNSDLQLGLNLQYSTTNNIPRYDRLTQTQNGILRFAEWEYGPQKRILISPNIDFTGNIGQLFDKISVKPFYQNISQQRITRRYRSSSRFTQTETVNIAGINLDFTKKYRDALTHLAGLDFTFNDVNSKATELNITNNTEKPAVTRYPPGKNTVQDYAIYSKWLYKISNWSFDAGLRYQYRILKSEVGDASFYPVLIPDFEQKNGALAGNVGMAYSMNSNNILKLGFSRGFRAPNIDDTGKIFDSSPGNVIVPSPDAKPETANSVELSWENASSAYSFYITPFLTFLQNAIIVTSGTFEGKDSLLYQGVPSKVQVITNADKATVYGIQVGFTVKLNSVLNLMGNISYTKGRYQAKNSAVDVPLDHIPPVFGSLKFLYEKHRFNTGLQILFNGKKRLEDYSPSGEDNLNQATPNGMPAWVVGNIFAGYNFDRIDLSAGIDNILDTHFRTFASGINAPGRNFKVSLKYILQ